MEILLVNHIDEWHRRARKWGASPSTHFSYSDKVGLDQFSTGCHQVIPKNLGLKITIIISRPFFEISVRIRRFEHDID